MSIKTQPQKPQPQTTPGGTSEHSGPASEHSPEHFTGNAGAPADTPTDHILLIEHIGLGHIHPSPLNPRKRFDEAALKDLADSIRAHSVQQPIVVRPLCPLPGSGRPLPGGGKAVTRSDITGGTLQIVMGERRFRASALAGRETIPCLLRDDIDDRTHAVLALEENLRRQDLSPMEEARGFKQCMDLGTTQREIGETAGVGQSRISNLIRLLELPGDVQQMIDDGKLTAGHGVALARYKDFPALCSHLARMAVDAQWSVRTLEEGLTPQTTAGLLGDVGKPRLIVNLDGYPYAAFDTKAVCPQCPFGAYRASTGVNGAARRYCLNPAHYDELNEAAKAVQDEKRQAETERMRGIAIKKSKAAQQKLAEATTKAARVEAETERQQACAAVKALEKGLPTIEYGKIEELRADCPAECKAQTCGCFILARPNYGSGTVNACADPKRLARLKATQSKEQNSGRKEVFKDLGARLSEVNWDSRMAEPQARRLMALIAWPILRNAKSGAKKEVAARLPETGNLGAIRTMLGHLGYEVKDADARAALAALTPTEQLYLAGEIFLRADLIERFDYGSDKAEKVSFFLDTPGAPTDVPTELQNTGTSSLFPCADCRLPDIGAFWVDANGYETDKSDIGGSWVCGDCQEKRKAEVATEQILCSQCQNPLASGAFDSALAAASLREHPIRMTSGELLLPDGRAFCDQCGPQTGNDGSPFDDETDEEPVTISDAQDFHAGDVVSFGTAGNEEIGTVQEVRMWAGALTARVTIEDGKEFLPRVDSLRRYVAPNVKAATEPADDWSYAPPEAKDEGWCASCGVQPVHAPARFCPFCETPVHTRQREEAALA